MKEGSWAFGWPRDRKGVSQMDAGLSDMPPAREGRVNMRVQTLGAGKIFFHSLLCCCLSFPSLSPFLLIPF